MIPKELDITRDMSYDEAEARLQRLSDKEKAKHFVECNKRDPFNETMHPLDAEKAELVYKMALENGIKLLYPVEEEVK